MPPPTTTTLARAINRDLETISDRFEAKFEYLNRFQLEENRKIKVFTLELRDRLDTLQQDHTTKSYELSHEIADLRTILWELRSTTIALRNQVSSFSYELEKLEKQVQEYKEIVVEHTNKRRLVDRPGGRLSERETELSSISSRASSQASEVGLADTLLETYTPNSTESEH